MVCDWFGEKSSGGRGILVLEKMRSVAVLGWDGVTTLGAWSLSVGGVWAAGWFFGSVDDG